MLKKHSFFKFFLKGFSYFTLGIFTSLTFSVSLHGAEKIYFIYSSIEETLNINSLETFAQNKGELYDTIAKLDSAFFKALNECDLKKYESFLAFDYEFYHDKQGLTVSKTSEMKSMSLFCGEQRERLAHWLNQSLVNSKSHWENSNVKEVCWRQQTIVTNCIE